MDCNNTDHPLTFSLELSNGPNFKFVHYFSLWLNVCRTNEISYSLSFVLLLSSFFILQHINISLTLCMFSEQGEVFVWGYGILGKGPKLSESSTPEMIPATLFGRSEFNPSVAVTRIRCGLHHFAAVTGEDVLLRQNKLLI